MPERLESFSRRLNFVCEMIVAALVAATILDVIDQVFFRYVLNASLSWSEELARYMFVWIIFLGTSVAFRRKQHIAMEALVGAFPPRARPWLSGFALAVSLAFFCLFLYVSIALAQNASYQLSTALQIPMSWVYAAAPVGAALTIVHLVTALLRLTSPASPAPAG